MKKKVSVSEFAAEVGTTAKTIYERIKKNSELPLNEQLETVNEKVKGREVTLINTDTDQIEIYKNIYGKDTVIEGEYYETLTDNNGYKTFNNVNENVKINENNSSAPDLFERLTTLNNEYNNRIDTVKNELIEVNKQLATANGNLKLLEYQAGRDALILNENQELKKETKRKSKVINILVTVIILLLIVIITAATYFITVNNLQKTENIESVKTEATVPVVQQKETL